MKHAKDAGLYVVNLIFVFVAVFQRSMPMETVPLTLTASLEPRAPAVVNVFVELPWSPRRIKPSVVSRDFHLVSFFAVRSSHAVCVCVCVCVFVRRVSVCACARV